MIFLACDASILSLKPCISHLQFPIHTSICLLKFLHSCLLKYPHPNNLSSGKYSSYLTPHKTFRGLWNYLTAGITNWCLANQLLPSLELIGIYIWPHGTELYKRCYLIELMIYTGAMIFFLWNYYHLNMCVCVCVCIYIYIYIFFFFLFRPSQNQSFYHSLWTQWDLWSCLPWVPMVGIPLLSDQLDNVSWVKAKGTAVELDLHKMMSSDLLNALNEVINNLMWV